MQKTEKWKKWINEKESKKFPFLDRWLTLFLEMQIRLLLHAQGDSQRMGLQWEP